MLFKRNHPIVILHFVLIQLIPSIDYHNIITCLDKNNKQFPNHNQKIMIVNELNICFGEIYLVG